jgi:hypothetical protein
VGYELTRPPVIHYFAAKSYAGIFGTDLISGVFAGVGWVGVFAKCEPTQSPPIPARLTALLEPAQSAPRPR